MSVTSYPAIDPRVVHDPLSACYHAAVVARDSSAVLLDSLLGGQERTATPARRVAPELLDQLKAGEAAACEELVIRYQRLVFKIASRVLGADSELEDVVQEVFVVAFDKIHAVRHPEALTSWMMRVAASVTRQTIRRRTRRQWLRIAPSEDVPEMVAPPPDAVGSATLARVYATLDRLPTDERMAFSLRFFCDLELTQVAAACECSLATIKRRLSKAEKRFVTLARRDPLLADRIEASGRWGEQ